MPLVEKVKGICREHMQELAETIEGELKAECPARSGEAQASIGIEPIDDYHIFVGGSNMHLYYADQGNNQSGGRIYPHGNALAFHGWGKWAGGGHGKPNGKYVLPSVSAYEGKHFVKKVADRHR